MRWHLFKLCTCLKTYSMYYSVCLSICFSLDSGICSIEVGQIYVDGTFNG